MQCAGLTNRTAALDGTLLLICQNSGGSVYGRRGVQMPAAEIQPNGAITVCQESEVSDLNEARRQDVEQEAADELDCIQGHCLGAVAIFGIPPTKGDLALFKAHQIGRASCRERV